MAPHIGICGSASDPQCTALNAALRTQGAVTTIVESQALNQGGSCAVEDGRWSADGQPLDEADCWYVRYVMAPLAPAFKREETYHLYGDWYVQYMRRRERAAFQLSWLIELTRRGVPVVNPPQHASALPLKPFQLAAAGAAGLTVPRTLITNDPWRVHAFIESVGDVVYKPSLGGGPCRALDGEARARLAEITAAPVTFQERVVGSPVRVTVVGDEVISSVELDTNALDYRTDPRYREGAHGIREIALPDGVRPALLTMLRDAGLLFAGVDFIRRASDEWVFLEANAAPIYLDIEERAGHQITVALAELLLRLARSPTWAHDRIAEAQRARSLVAYALPFDPEHLVGG